MKLISFVRKGMPGWGVVTDGGVLDMTDWEGARTLRDVLELGLLPHLSEALDLARPDLAMSDVTLLPVIPDPGKILCIGLNYLKHKQETGRPDVDHPTVFTRYADSQVAHLAPQPVVTTYARSDVLLDTLPPDQPLLLVYDTTPEAHMNEAMMASLLAKGVAVVGMTPESVNPADASFPIVRDKTKFFGVEPWQSALGCTFLLRSDRYVAAIARTEQINSLIPMIDRIRAPRAEMRKDPSDD